MSWVTDDGTHEGWAAATFADGGLGSGWGNGGVLVARIGGRWLVYDDWQYRPEAQVTGWLSVCECGWRGTPWTRVPDPGGHEPAARRVYSADGDSPAEVEEACRGEWREHVRPHRVLAEVSDLVCKHADLVREHADVGRRLTEAVGRALAVGASWADIGAAAGITGQSAHDRWRDVPAPGIQDGCAVNDGAR